MLTIYKFRLKDRHAALLNRQAQAVNIVWNYCNDAQRHALKHGNFLNWHDLQKLTAGSTREGLDLHSHTVQQVCQTYDQSRRIHRRPWLKFRGLKSLGWVPFNNGHVKFDGIAFIFRGMRYIPMHYRDLAAGTKIRAGCFNQDRRGRWYLNVTVDVPDPLWGMNNPVGIDLGLKNLAAFSDAARPSVVLPQFYRRQEGRLASLQKARKTKGLRRLHAKVSNRRKDFLHKLSLEITNEYGLIIVGDVSPSRLAKTQFAKSVYDAGWYAFKQMLSYKSIRNGGRTIEVSERLTSRTCSSCGAVGGLGGIASLCNRVWACNGCGAVHDRDVNAARNILAVGLDSLVGGAA